MRTFLTLSVLTSCTLLGCTSTGQTASTPPTRADLTAADFVRSYTSDKNRYHPDWANDINRPAERPAIIPNPYTGRYSLEGRADITPAAEPRPHVVPADNTVRTERADRTVAADTTPPRSERDDRPVVRDDRMLPPRTARPSDVDITNRTDLSTLTRMYVDDAGRYRPDWAHGINTPAAQPKALPDHTDLRYTWER